MSETDENMPPQWRMQGDWGGFRGWGGGDEFPLPNLNMFIQKEKNGRASLSRKLAVFFNFVVVERKILASMASETSSQTREDDLTELAFS